MRRAALEAWSVAFSLVLGLGVWCVPLAAQAHGTSQDADNTAPIVGYADHPDISQWLEQFLISPAWAQASIEIKNGYRIIHADGLPNHATGAFPNAHNPNRIQQQSYTFRVPLHPKRAKQTTPLGMQPFGIARNGVLFDPGAAEYWRNDPQSGWQYEAMGGGLDLGLDQNNAHVQPNGAYHYHGMPTGLLKTLAKGNEPILLGWAADGFPIYAPYGFARNADGQWITLRSSWRIKAGKRPDGPGGNYDGRFTQDYEYVPGLGDLDACNGRMGATPEFPDGIYHYVLTTAFPFIPRCFSGTPDASFARKGPPPGRMQRRPRPGFPPDGPPPPPEFPF